MTRTPERRAEFQRRNPGLAFEFFDAVDGSSLTEADLAATGLFPPGIGYTPGAYGAALSHHRLWEQAAIGDAPLTIAEDDAVFRSDFAETQARLLAGLPHGWDFVLWGFNFDAVLSFWLPFGVRTVMYFRHSQTGNVVERLHADRAQPQLHRLEFSFGLPAYTISPAGAQRFKDACFPMREFSGNFPLLTEPVKNFGVDVAMTPVYPQASAHVCFPPLVVTKNDRAASTIQTQTSGDR